MGIVRVKITIVPQEVKPYEYEIEAGGLSDGNVKHAQAEVTGLEYSKGHCDANPALQSISLVNSITPQLSRKVQAFHELSKNKKCYPSGYQLIVWLKYTNSILLRFRFRLRGSFYLY